MTKFLAAALAVAAVAFVTLPASSADAVMKRLTAQRLSTLLQASGATQIAVAKPKPGVEIVSFNDGKGTVDFVLEDCTAEGCETLQMMILFEKDAKPYALGGINSYNSKVLNAQAAVLTDGKLMLARLFVTLGGVTDENIKANYGIFLQAPYLLAQHMGSQTVAEAPAPATGAVPVSAKVEPKVEAGVAMAVPRLRNIDVIDWLAARPNRPLHKLPQ